MNEQTQNSFGCCIFHSNFKTITGSQLLTLLRKLRDCIKTLPLGLCSTGPRFPSYSEQTAHQETENWRTADTHTPAALRQHAHTHRSFSQTHGLKIKGNHHGTILNDLTFKTHDQESPVTLQFLLPALLCWLLRGFILDPPLQDIPQEIWRHTLSEDQLRNTVCYTT